MTAIFMSFSRNGKRSRKRKTEITGKYNRKALADGWIEQQGEEKKRVPDTAHDCPILRIGVMHEQSVSEREIHRNGAFLFLPQSVPAPQNHRHLHFVF